MGHFSHCSQGQSVSRDTVTIDSTKSNAEKFMRQVGGVVSTDHRKRVVALQFPENTILPQNVWQHLAQLTDLQELDLGAMHVSNDDVKAIGNLIELRNLNLFGNPLDSVCLTYLEGLQKLETLYLYRTFVDDECLKSICQFKNLKRLNMFDTFLTDKGLDALGTCKQLDQLCIGNSKAGNFPESFFSQAAIDRLKAALPNTRIVYWGAKKQLDLPEVIGKDTIPVKARRKQAELTLPEIPPSSNLSKRTVGDDWPCFLGAAGDGKSAETKINTRWTVKPPRLVWHRKIGTGYAAPSISNGRLMLYHRVRGKKKPFEERLSCFESDTGAVLWEVNFPTDYSDLNGYGDGPRSTPVIDGDRTFLLSPEGVLRCLQTVNGSPVWKVDLDEAFDLDLISYGVGTTPVVYKNLILVIAGGKEFENRPAKVIALDKRTGVFKYGVGQGAASYATPVITAWGGRWWCFAFARDGLLVFDPDTGKEDFEFPWKSNIAGGVNATSPVVDGNRVFISEAYGRGSALLGFDESGAKPIWQDVRRQRSKSMEMHWSTPVLHEKFLYGCSGRHSVSGVLKCVAFDTGKTVWQHKMRDRTSVTFVAGHLLNLGENGDLTLVEASPDGYQEAGRLDSKNTSIVPSYPAWTAPVVARGMMYLRGKQEIICYDLSDDQ